MKAAIRIPTVDVAEVRASLGLSVAAYPELVVGHQSVADRYCGSPKS